MINNTWQTDPRIAETIYAVESNSFAEHMLWREWHESITWEQDCHGRIVQLGSLAGRPVNLSLSWSLLDGHLVCFYDAVSQVVDHAMVEAWLAERGWKRSNAENFDHCIHEIQRRTGKTYQLRAA